jgi:nicotinamidase-related amidase
MIDIYRAALVVIDLQNDFVRTGAPMEVEDARNSLPTVRLLIEAAREKSLPIIYTKFISGPDKTLLWNWSPEIEQYGACRRGLKRYYSDLQAERQCSDVVDEIYPQSEDYIVEKYGYSAFRYTCLRDLLISEGRDSIIVVGTVTQVCVADTVHDAFGLGFKVLVVSDCVTSYMPDLQEAFLQNFALKFAWVKKSSEVFNLIRES